MIRIENWCVRPINASPYVPPEHAGQCVHGEVYGHPRFPDGDRIATSQIVEVNDREVTTNSGTVYTLGEISADYLSWCKKTDGIRTPSDGDWIRVHKVG